MKETLPKSGSVLTMGILSVATFFVCCGPFAIIFSIIGLIQAKTAKELHMADPELYEGYNNVTTGRTLSIIGIVLSIIGFIFGIIYIGALIALLSNGNYSH